MFAPVSASGAAVRNTTVVEMAYTRTSFTGIAPPFCVTSAPAALSIATDRKRRV